MDATPAIRMLENGIPFVERCGFKVEALERGRVVCRMPIEGNTNHIGTMYAGALFTCALKGGYDACVKFVNALEIFSHVANLGDTRSLVIHSASTTHRQLSPEQQEAAGASPNVVRLSIGIEDADDLIADLDQALAQAHG